MKHIGMKLAVFLAVLLVVTMSAFASLAEELQLELTGETEITAYAPWYRSVTAEVCRISNYDDLTAHLSGSPSWTVQTLAQGNGFIYLNRFSNRVEVYFDSLYSTGDFEYLITCSWGELTAEWPLKIHVEEPDQLPTELIVPWPSVRAGDTFTFDCSNVSPAVPSGAVPVITLAAYDETALEVVSGNDGALTVRSLRAGTFPAKISWRIGNVELIATTCVEAANAEGDVPPVEIVFNSTSTDADTVYVGGYNPDYCIGTVHVDHLTLYAEALAETPVWSWEMIGGEADLVYADSWSDTSNYVNLYLSKAPTAAGEAIVRVTCSLAGGSASYDLALTVAECELGAPTGLNLPDTLELTVGQQVEFDDYDLVLPAGWQSANFCGNLSMNGVESSVAVLDEFSSVDKWGIMPKTAGEYTATFSWDYGNLMLTREVTLRIADENGVVPDMKPQLTGPSDVTLFTQGSFYWLDSIAEITMENYEALNAVYSDDPEWELTWLSGSEGSEECLYLHGWNEAYKQITAQENPGVGDVVARVDCTWGGFTGSHTFTLHVETLEGVPDPLLPQKEINTTVGSTFTLDLTDAVPAGNLPEGVTPTVSASSGYELLSIKTDGYRISCTGETAGTDVLTVEWKCANLTLNKKIRVRIDDGNGYVPPMQLEVYVSDYSDELYIGAGEDQTLTDIYIEDPGVLDGVPVWRYEVLSGDPSLLSFSGYGSDAYVYSARVADKAESVTIVVSCEWDGAVWSMEFTYEFGQFPGGTPAGINLPDSLTLAVGEEVTFDLLDVLLPLGASWDSNIGWYFDFYIRGNCAESTHLYDDQNQLIIEGVEPGVTTMHTSWEHAGYYFEHTMLITVQDENGGTGEEIKLELWQSNEKTTLLLGGNTLDCYIGRAYVDNFSTIMALGKGAPSWSVSTVSGEDGLVAIKNEGEDCELTLVQQPQKTGDTVVRLVCTWNGQTASTDFTLHVVDPEGMIPDSIPLEASYEMLEDGELTIDLSGAKPSFWETYEFNAYIDCTGVGYNYGYNAQTWELYLDYMTAGEYHAEITLRYANREISGSTIIHVKDENGSVPITFDVDLFSEYTTQYVGGSNLQLAVFDIMGYDAMYAKTGVEPELTVTISDETISASASLGEDSSEWTGEIVLDKQLSKPGSFTCTLDVTWDDVTVSRTLQFYAIEMPGGAPGGLNIPDCIVLNSGEQYVIYRSSLVQPAGWTTGMPACLLELIEHDDSGRKALLADWNYDFDTSGKYVYRACDPGTYSVTFRMTCANIVLEKDVQLVIRSVSSTDGPEINVPYVVTAPGLFCQMSVDGGTVETSGVKWASSAPAVVSVDRKGVLMGVNAGTAVITASVTLVDGSEILLAIEAECVDGSVFTLPSNLKEIGEEAFLDNAAQIVVIPEGATALGIHALAQMANLRIVVLPDSLMDIADDLLSGSEMAVVYCHPGTAAAAFADHCGLTWMPLP